VEQLEASKSEVLCVLAMVASLLPNTECLFHQALAGADHESIEALAADDAVRMDLSAACCSQAGQS
jgi:hypothetical protein